VKIVLCTEGDDERNIWLDAVAPIQLKCAFGYRLGTALRVCGKG
jgi:hypothetical protein